MLAGVDNTSRRACAFLGIYAGADEREALGACDPDGDEGYLVVEVADPADVNEGRAWLERHMRG